MKIRSFLAFDIPDDMKTELAGLIDILSSKAQGVRWMNPANIHCTIKFFGDVEEDVLNGPIAAAVERQLAHQAPFGLDGIGIGVFPNWRYPRVIWAGLTGDTETATSLYTRIDAALRDFHIKPDNRKAFRLHLTLGRVKSKIKDPSALVSFVEKQVGRHFGRVVVSRLVLYKSVLTKEGPIYTPMREFAFGSS